MSESNSWTDYQAWLLAHDYALSPVTDTMYEAWLIDSHTTVLRLANIRTSTRIYVKFDSDDYQP